MIKSKVLISAVALALAIGSTGPSAAESPASFPAAGVDVITHALTVGLYNVRPSGELGALLETVEFKGRMMIERGDPYLDEEIGRRRVDFVVKSWEANGWSEKLNSLVTYRLSDTAQKTSTITAQQKESDYPATFHFRVTFDALAYDEVLTTIFEGEPSGGEFMEVPPSGNRRTSPTMTKFENHWIETDHPSLGRIRFVPLSCEDEGGETLVTFSEEAKRVLRQRETPGRKPARSKS